MPEIYYLQWDDEDNVDARDRFHEYHLETPKTLSYTEFDQLYDPVAEVEADDLNEIYREWNRGSGYETEKFLSQQVRSMSVGDIVERDHDHYMCASIGWDEVDIIEGGYR
ncbi:MULTISPECIES: hypothetical protein [Haloferacaceae]|uniref:Uncharacterized protein n=1 Tax=Halorubrum glutamatedens TaxID=2707018 RepID=A0ABD5QNI0_9EURY|nr:hypothetical protein [Halobellus captivus]